MSKLASLPCELPTTSISESIDGDKVAKSFEQRIASLEPCNLLDHAIWRDIFALTGTLRTFYGSSRILDTWTRLGSAIVGSSVRLVPGSSRRMQAGAESAWLDAQYTFETNADFEIRGTIILSLVPTPEEEWKIWIIRTVLDQIPSFGNIDIPKELPVSPGIAQELPSHEGMPRFNCVVVGGGPAGLSTAGRLQAMSLSYVLLDRNAEVGGSWRVRYDSARSEKERYLFSFG